jgi:protein-S-isoprenylcysteine O-methyltransferase Ste14
MPVVDRAIAIVALSPFALQIWWVLHAASIPVEYLLLVIVLAVLVVNLLIRRPPRRVTPNPLFWLITFSVTYWPFYAAVFYTAGIRVAPAAVSIAVSAVGFVISIWARFSLGRNFGFVPAERQIVANGAYRFVRHPIFTGIFILIVGNDLAAFSWRNLALSAIWVGLFVIKSLIEESFLSESVEYSAYKSRVRWRWFPGIA